MAIRPIVVDINHADGSRDGEDLIDFVKVRKSGILAVIHKATEGERFVDPLYKSRKARVLAVPPMPLLDKDGKPTGEMMGLLWGAYHFMRPGDVGNQVSHFLSVARANDTRFMLDYEDEKLGLWQAERWCELIHIATGQRPWLYGGGVLKEQLARRHTPSLAQYPLALAEYGPVAKVPEPWKKYVLWQRSGDGIGPGIHDIPGIGRKQDIDYFDGTDEELRVAWLDKGAGPSVG